jgi:sulfide:quinone oxidoreductase
MGMAATRRHQVAIIGGGSAGIAVAARGHRAGVANVAVIDPATTHFASHSGPFGGGLVDVRRSDRSQASVILKGTTWIRAGAAAIDLDARTVTRTRVRRWSTPL